MLRRISIVVLAAASVLGASLLPARAQTRDLLPPAFAGLPLTDVKEFEDHALGLGARYGGGERLATLYIYDAGLPEIAAGIESAALCEQFEEAKRNVRQTVEAGMVDSAVLEREGTFQAGSPPHAVPLREAVFTVRQGEVVYRSYIYMTAGRNLLFKVRYSVSAAGEPDPTPDMVARALSDLVAALAR